MTKKELFLKLMAVDVTPHLKHDNFTNLDYLSWAKCHQLMMENTEEYEYNYVGSTETGLIHRVNGSPFVSVEVKADGIAHVEMLPIMHGKANASMNLEEITSRDVFDTLKRCYVKACAMLGLGLRVYQGDIATPVKAPVKAKPAGEYKRPAPVKTEPKPEPKPEVSDEVDGAKKALQFMSESGTRDFDLGTTSYKILVKAGHKFTAAEKLILAECKKLATVDDTVKTADDFVEKF